MSYHNKIELKIELVSSPKIIKNCSKCGGKSHFSNTGNFRVNANGNCIDVWLIYACCQCKTTYNMTLFERISPNEIRRDHYEKFLLNDKNLAMSYGCNNQILKRNKAEVDWKNMTYRISEKVLENQEYQEYQEELFEPTNIKDRRALIVYKISCKYPLKIRIDRLFAECLHISRTKVKHLIDIELIKELNAGNFSKKYISDGMEFILEQKFL